MNRKFFALAVLAAAGLLILAASPAGAQVKEKTGDVQLFGGWNDPGSDVDGDMVWGVRFGGNFTPRFGMQGSAGWVAANEEFAGTDYDLDITLLDISGLFHFNPEDRLVGYFATGPGWVWASAEADVSEYEDSFSWHFGLGGKLYATESFFIQPDVRYRWVSEGSGNDWEATVGFAWQFGGKGGK